MTPLLLLKRIIDAPLFTWIILAIPSVPLVKDIWVKDRYYAEIMYESGLLSIQFLVLALAITPAMHLLRGWKFLLPTLSWLRKRRRYIGVAAFGYAALHTFYYIRKIGELDLIVLEFFDVEFTVGWIAMFLMLALAMTSNNLSVQKMGLWWKTLQRFAYAVALFTVLHWYLIGQFLNEMTMWFLPLLIVQIPRVYRHFFPARRSKAA